MSPEFRGGRGVSLTPKSLASPAARACHGRPPGEGRQAVGGCPASVGTEGGVAWGRYGWCTGGRIPWGVSATVKETASSVSRRSACSSRRSKAGAHPRALPAHGSQGGRAQRPRRRRSGRGGTSAVMGSQAWSGQVGGEVRHRPWFGGRFVCLPQMEAATQRTQFARRDGRASGKEPCGQMASAP